MNYMTCTV